MKAAAAALLLGGCVSPPSFNACDLQDMPIPAWPEAHYHAEDCPGAWPVDDVSLAMHVFEMEWGRSFGVDPLVTAALSRSHVFCVPRDWPHSGIMLNGAVYVSLVDARDDTCRPLPKSAFTHEMVHLVLEAVTGNGDADHAESDQLGDSWQPPHDEFIARVDKWLAEALRTDERHPMLDGVCFDPCKCRGST